MRENIVKFKSFNFAIQVVETNKLLIKQNEFILSKQLLRSGTAIGALIREAEHAESKKDFIHKMAISLKEANETEYWIDLLHQTNYLNKIQYNSLRDSLTELLKLLIAIIKSSKLNL